MEAPFFFSIFLAPRLSFTYCSFHQQVVSVYVGPGPSPTTMTSNPENNP